MENYLVGENIGSLSFLSLEQEFSTNGIFALNNPLAALSWWTAAAICSEGFPPLSRSAVDN